MLGYQTDVSPRISGLFESEVKWEKIILGLV